MNSELNFLEQKMMELQRDALNTLSDYGQSRTLYAGYAIALTERLLKTQGNIVCQIKDPVEQDKAAEEMIGIYRQIVFLCTKSTRTAETVIEIEDPKGCLYEAAGFCRETLDLISYMKTSLSQRKAVVFLYLLNGTDVKKALDQTRDHVAEFQKYIDALRDFQDSDHFSDTFYDGMDELDVIRQSFECYRVMMAELHRRERAKKAGVNIEHLEEVFLPVYDLARRSNVLNEKKEVTADNAFRDFAKKSGKKFVDAMDEIAEILRNPDNFTGYHINHIESKRKVYGFLMDIPTKEKDKDGGTVYEEKMSDDFPTEKERNDAEQTFLNGHPEAGVIEEFAVPKDEWWVVVENSTNTARWPISFPSELRALVYLFLAAKPEAMVSYKESVESDEQ